MFTPKASGAPTLGNVCNGVSGRFESFSIVAARTLVHARSPDTLLTSILDTGLGTNISIRPHWSCTGEVTRLGSFVFWLSFLFSCLPVQVCLYWWTFFLVPIWHYCLKSVHNILHYSIFLFINLFLSV